MEKEELKAIAPFITQLMWCQTKSQELEKKWEGFPKMRGSGLANAKKLRDSFHELGNGFIDAGDIFLELCEKIDKENEEVGDEKVE